MAIKIPLKMSDGTAVRTIEELREHFDLADVLGYYEGGRLTRWLSDGYYDEEAEKVKALDSSSEDLGKELCNILGVDYREYDKIKKFPVDLKDISKKNERLERLKQYTDDDRILAFIDNVAFTQEELDDLLKKGDALEKDDDDNTVIYLCGEHFTIPENIGGIIYKGVRNPNPTVTFAGIKYEFVDQVMRVPWDIDLQDLEFDVVSYVDEISRTRGNDDSHGSFIMAFSSNSDLGMKFLHIAAEKGSPKAQYMLGSSYQYGEPSIIKDSEEAVKWYLKAAEQGYAKAQLSLGLCYEIGEGVPENKEEAIMWYRKAAERGLVRAQNWLGFYYYNGEGVPENKEEAVKWYREAAEQGSWGAQCQLGKCYYNGEGVPENKEEAVKWYREAAEQGYREAQYELGKCYYNGEGVPKNKEEAVKWYREAAEQRYGEAQYELGKCYEWGDGVEENPEEAVRWYRKAEEWYQELAEEDDEEAQEMLQKIAESISSLT